MILKRAAFTFLLVAVACAGRAAAKETWICTLGPHDDRKHAFPTKVEVAKRKLLIYSADSSVPVEYDVLEDTQRGIIATHHSPRVLIVALFRPHIADIVLRSLSLGTSYEDHYSGPCKKAQ